MDRRDVCGHPGSIWPQTVKVPSRAACGRSCKALSRHARQAFPGTIETDRDGGQQVLARSRGARASVGCSTDGDGAYLVRTVRQVRAVSPELGTLVQAGKRASSRVERLKTPQRRDRLITGLRWRRPPG